MCGRILPWPTTVGVQINPDVEVVNWDFMKKLVIKGMGIGCIPREYCKAEFESGELFEVICEPSLPVRGIGIALAKNVSLSFAVKEFLAMFETD